MKASKAVFIPLLAVCLTAAGEPVAVKSTIGPALAMPTPTTIGELSDQARQKRVSDETKPAAPAVPPGMQIVPSTEIVTSDATAAAAAKAPPKKVKKTPPPEVVPGLLAIGKAGAGQRFVELADTGGPSKYTVGQITPSGWMVTSIGAQLVDLMKPGVKKKPARHLSLSIVTP